MEPERCRKCGSTSFVAKHKGPHIGWYCTKCGTWLRWIPQHDNKAQLTEPHQMSIEDLGITMPEDRNCKPSVEDIHSLYDKDALPWE